MFDHSDTLHSQSLDTEQNILQYLWQWVLERDLDGQLFTHHSIL